MRVRAAPFRYDRWAYANAREMEEMRVMVGRCAGGFEDLGSGIGGSNATVAGGFDDLGSGIGGSNATTAGGFDDLGSGIGGSNATAAGGFDDLGSGIGGSNATAAGGFDDLGSGIGELHGVERSGSRGLGMIRPEAMSVRVLLRHAKCGFSSRHAEVAESNEAPEASNPEVANESIITQ